MIEIDFYAKNVVIRSILESKYKLVSITIKSLLRTLFETRSSILVNNSFFSMTLRISIRLYFKISYCEECEITLK